MKPTQKLLTFAPKKLARVEIVAHALLFEGALYARASTWIDPDDANPPGGRYNCFGLLLSIARHAELWEGDPNLPPSNYGDQSQTKTFVELLDYNFVKVPKDNLKPGDVLLLRYFDTDIRHEEIHHVGMVTRAPSFMKRGQWIHASQNKGKVVIDDICELTYERIQVAYNLNNLTD